MNHDRLNKNGCKKYGIAFGETALFFQTPPNESQMFSKPQSGFGGWADEKIKTPREAAPNIEPEKISSTTFDNIFSAIRIHPNRGLAVSGIAAIRTTVFYEGAPSILASMILPTKLY